MYNRTQALVLYANQYPKGYIVHFYTREYGRVAYVVNDTKSRKSPFRKVLLQPLSMVDVVVEASSSQGLPKIREGSSSYLYRTVPYDVRKNTIALFLAEFLSVVLKDTQPDVSLFSFLTQSFLYFDEIQTGVANFHLAFLMKMTRFLGFEPNACETELPYFDLLEGEFSASQPQHAHFLNPLEARFFRMFVRMDYANMSAFRLSRENRIAILEHIMEYYRLHLDNFPSLKSLDVLKILFV